MKKTFKLNENDLVNIVKLVIKEQQSNVNTAFEKIKKGCAPNPFTDKGTNEGEITQGIELLKTKQDFTDLDNKFKSEKPFGYINFVAMIKGEFETDDKIPLEKIQNHLKSIGVIMNIGKKPSDQTKKTSEVKSDEITDKEMIILSPKGFKGDEAHVLFGGSHTSGYAKNTYKLSAMENYIPIVKPYAGNKMIVITHHFTNLSSVRKRLKEKYNVDVTSIAGFSQGGKEVWEHASDSSLKLVGLVDPSTYKTGVSFGPNTYLVCDPKNWGTTGFYGQTRERLKWYCENKDNSKYKGHIECTTGHKHMNFGILKYFYEKFGSRI